VASVADLASVPLFEGLGDAELKELAAWFDVQAVSAGVKLASEGASGYSFYVLLEGSAVVSSGDEAVAICEPGDFFGEMAILGDSRRTATVTTTSPARLLVMFGTEFRRLQDSQPAIAAQLEQAMRERTRG
jgi:CRP-like cAMP-binding protein